MITGDIIDQSQLHGILDWLGGRGIEIVSLSPAEGIGEAEEMGGLASDQRELRAVHSQGLHRF